MARVTVEDCVEKVSNRFELVMMAAQRSRDINNGMEINVERDQDKNPVVALREIAEEAVPIEELEESLIRNMQRQIDQDEIEEEDPLEVTYEDLLEVGGEIPNIPEVNQEEFDNQTIRFQDIAIPDLED